MSLLSTSVKIKLSNNHPVWGESFLSTIMYLAPHKMAGLNVCADSTAGCRESCLFSAGRGVTRPVYEARMRRTIFFRTETFKFMDCLRDEVSRFERKARKLGKRAVVRFNGTSDIPWERIKTGWGQSIFETFPQIQFYDYTKNHTRMVDFLQEKLPANYHLTFSRSETTIPDVALATLSLGGNVAVVFRKKEYIPAMYYGAPVVNGDEHDLTFVRPRGCVIGLYAKGRAKKDTTGFVVDNSTQEYLTWSKF